MDCDVLVFGNDREARDTVIALAGALGAASTAASSRDSVVGKALCGLIAINRRYKVAGAGIRITGIPR